MERKLKTKRARTRFAVSMLAPLMITVMLLITGCGGEGMAAALTTTPTPTPTPTIYPSELSENANVTSGKNEKKVKKEKEEEGDLIDIVEGDLEKNFEKALKHVKICGKEVSYPLTLKKLGKDFTFKKGPYQPEEYTDTLGELYYKGKRIASIWIEDGQMGGDIREKSIRRFTVNLEVAGDDVDVEICGIDYKSSVDTLCDVFGEKEIKNSLGLVYSKNGADDDARQISFEFIRNGCPTTLHIFYKKEEK